MKLPVRSKTQMVALLLFALVLPSCVSNNANVSSAAINLSNAELQQRVEAAIANASDVPEQLRVETANGVVRLIGSLQCENCGGNRTPGTLGTIQQSIGAVVRAVPGVSQVEFALEATP